MLAYKTQEGRRQCAIYYTSAYSFANVIMFAKLWVLLMNFEWSTHVVECSNLSPNNCNL